MILVWMRRMISRSWFRIVLAVALVMVGLAPVGAPILSDNSWRQAALPGDDSSSAAAAAKPFIYRWNAGGSQNTKVERSDDGGLIWHSVAGFPRTVAQLQAVRGDEQIVAARTEDAVWISRDGGSSWSLAQALPSKPLSLAVTRKDAGMVLVGTESVGVLVSRDRGESWQASSDPALAEGAAAPLAVNALAVDPADDSICMQPPASGWAQRTPA